jgi:hypothetical protein
MPLLFAFTPSILFQGKLNVIEVPELEGGAPFATVLKINPQEGGEYQPDDIVALLQTGDRTIEVRAEKNARVLQVIQNPGAMVNPGDALLRGEIAPTPLRITMSFVSAILGTIAFSSLTMFYWIRRTSLVEWLLLAPATVLLYWPTIVTDIAGIVLVGLVWFMQRSKNKRDQALGATATV